MLLGYLYAHLLHLRPRRRAWVVHAVALLIPLVVTLPIALPGWAPPEGDGWPVGRLLAALSVMVGPPFLVLTSTGPLLQRWFADSDHPRAHDPYLLYAAGNVGSLLALLSYPVLIEPALPLRVQSAAWSVGYGVFVLLTAVTVTMLARRPAAVPVAAGTPGAPGAPTTGRAARRAAPVEVTVLPSPPPGPVQLRCRMGETGLVTDWFCR